MSATLTVKGSVGFPREDDPAAPAPAPSQIDLALALIFGQKADLELNYDGAVTDQVIGLGTAGNAPGAKFLLIKCTVGTASVKLNDDISGKPISAVGGYILIANPTQGWLTGIKLTTTGAAKVRIWVRG